jgi:hypothetical protein
VTAFTIVFLALLCIAQWVLHGLTWTTLADWVAYINRSYPHERSAPLDRFVNASRPVFWRATRSPERQTEEG